MVRFVVALLILSYSGCYVMAEEPDARIQRGQALAKSLCAECHTISGTNQGPHARAPAFARLEQRLDLDSLLDRLREGLTSNHPDMPTFRFTREDARALIAYLRSIQRP